MVPREELHRPLEGPREFQIQARGPFVLRMNPIHVAESVSASIRRREIQFAEESVRRDRAQRIERMLS